MANGDGVPGYYGKLPSHGDFVSRRLPQAFLRPWDEWLQNVLACSREQLGDHWLETYLTSPLWRFVLSPNLLSEGAWAGLLMPSVDRVGRYFPFTIATPVAPGFGPIEMIELADSWFERLDGVGLAALEDECDLEALDHELEALGRPSPEGVTVGTWRQGSTRQGKLVMRCGVASIGNSGAILPALTTRVLRTVTTSHSVWWSQGSERVQPSILLTEGLPPVTGFAAFLDGGWGNWGWDDDTQAQPPAAHAGH